MKQAASFKFDWFFNGGISGRLHRLRWLWLLMLYALGAVVWGFFLDWGRIQFDLHDWTQEGPRLYFLREALLSGQLPLHISSPLFAGERFLAVPDTLFSPQILLLKVLEPGPFVLVNLLLMYTAGTAGVALLTVRRHWSPFSMTIAFFLLNFNGQIVTQLAVGHTMWMTAFLLPFFVLLVLDLLEGKGSWGWVLKLSVLLLVFFLQGGFHFVTWTLLFLLILALVVPRHHKQVLAGVGFSLLLCMPRVLPTAIEMAGVRRQFISGFFSLADLLEALASLKFPYQAGAEKYASLGWWEVDNYIGLVGLLLLVFGLWRTWKDVDSPSRQVLLPLFLYSLLCLGKLYQPVTMLPIPLFNAERVATRFLLLSLVIVIILSVDQLEVFLRKQKLHSIGKITAAGLVLILAHDLLQHVRLWRVENMSQLFSRTPVDITAEVLRIQDPVYTGALVVGVGIAVLAAGVLLVLIRRERAIIPPQSGNYLQD
ncbi:MAG: hypothetical protein JXA25_16590 [Anaerolineales bacterium]|nr:hypothetical protein [Anaerolineales bacterium]